jgi:hypothetical protein
MNQTSGEASAGRARMSGDQQREKEIVQALLEWTSDLVRRLAPPVFFRRRCVCVHQLLWSVSVDLPRRVERHTFAADPVDDPAAWMAEMERFLRRVFRRGSDRRKRKGVS